MNEYTTIAIFCHLDDLAKCMKLREPCEKMTTSEVALVGAVASIWFGGNLTSASQFLKKNVYSKHAKHKSFDKAFTQYSRRLLAYPYETACRKRYRICRG